MAICENVWGDNWSKVREGGLPLVDSDKGLVFSYFSLIKDNVC